MPCTSIRWKISARPIGMITASTPPVVGERCTAIESSPASAWRRAAAAVRPSWTSATEFFYTADGKIRKRTLGGASFTDVPFTATVQATPARGTYTRARRDFDSRTPRKTLSNNTALMPPTASGWSATRSATWRKTSGVACCR